MRGGRGRSAQLLLREEVVAAAAVLDVVAVGFVVSVFVAVFVAVVVVLAFVFGFDADEAVITGVDTTRRGLDSLAVGGDEFLSLWLWRAGVFLVGSTVFVFTGTTFSVADSGDEDGLLDRNRNSGLRGESLDPRFASFLEASGGEEDEEGRERVEVVWNVEKEGIAGSGASFACVELLLL